MLNGHIPAFYFPEHLFYCIKMCPVAAGIFMKPKKKAIYVKAGLLHSSVMPAVNMCFFHLHITKTIISTECLNVLSYLQSCCLYYWCTFKFMHL